MRWAIIADIHSNFPALQATLDDIAMQDVDEIILAGDAINAGPYPREVLDTIYAHKWRMVMGNHEEYMLACRNPDTSPYSRDLWPAFYWTLDRLTADDLRFIEDLPEAIIVDEMAIMHGAPSRLNWGVLPSTSDETLAKLYAEVPQRVIVTAHTHIPLVIDWRDKLIINPGSVGMSFDGNPMASYVILTSIENRFLIQHRRVAYDVSLIEQAAEERGFLGEGGVFARNFINQMTQAYPQSRSLLAQIDTLQAEKGLSMVEAIALADFSKVEPDYDYTYAQRKRHDTTYNIRQQLRSANNKQDEA